MAGTLALINPAKSRRRKRLPPRGRGGRFVKRGSTARRTRRRRSTRGYSGPRHMDISLFRRKRRAVVRRRRKGARVTYRRTRRGGYHLRGRRVAYVRPRKGRKGRRVYRNPRGLGGYAGLITRALSGAIGATLVRTGLNYLPAAAAGPLLNGKMRYVTQGAGAILLGIVAQMIPVAIVKRAASDMALGALTVTLHEVLVNEVGPMIGQNLGGLGYWGSGYTVPGEVAGLGDYGGMGEYVGAPAGMQGLGEYLQ